MSKGRYEEVGAEAIQRGVLEHSSTDELALLSLKVLDTIDQNSPKLSAKEAMLVLKDAADIYLQLQRI